MSRIAALVLVLAACGSSAPSTPSTSRIEPPAAPTVPPAPVEPAHTAAERFDAWLVSFNSHDAAQIKAFREAHVASDAKGFAPPEDTAGFSEDIGGFDAIEVEETSATKHVVLIKEKASDQYARATLELDAAPPRRIRAMDLRTIRTPDKYLPKRGSDAEALAALKTEIAKQVGADEFSGAVLVAKAGKPIFVEAYGMADREHAVKNTVDTRFRIGSMNKMFTSVALLQLVQAGKVKLDAPIATYLPDYPNKTVSSKVTPHHLLSHTGGTGDIFGPEYEKNRLTLKTHADYVKLYGNRELGHEPGAKFEYSNYGFVLAGAVIEAVTKKSYYDVLRANVYAKAGMKSTASPLEADGLKGRVVAYMRESKQAPWTTAADTLPVRGTAAGGGDTTVKDLLAFANALTANKLINAKHLALATSSHVPADSPRPYGYGFMSDAYGSVHCFGHGGGAPGMNGQLYICDSGYTIAVLANLDPPAASRVADFLVYRLPAQ